MQKRNFIIAVVALVVGLGVIAYLLVDLVRVLDDLVGGNDGNRDPFILGDQIVYVCDDEAKTDQICVINSDGSGWKMITAQKPIDPDSSPESLPYVGYSDPSFNEDGHIVWACYDNGGLEARSYICHKNMQTARLDPVNEFWESDYIVNPLIGPEGDILYGCDDDLCHGRLGDQTSSYVEQSASFYPYFSLGYHQDAAFNCVIWIGDSETRYSISDICYAESMTSRGIKKLTHAPHDDTIQYTKPSLDHEKRIAFQCSEKVGEDERLFDICIANHDGTELRNLTSDTPFAGISSNPVISDNGFVIFECVVNSAEHLHKFCMTDIFGGEFRLLHEMQAQKSFGRVSVYRNLVVYECNLQICIINSDGSGFRQLTFDQEVLGE